MASEERSLPSPHILPASSKVQGQQDNLEDNPNWEDAESITNNYEFEVAYTHDGKLAQADAFRIEKKKLQDRLQSIAEEYSTSDVGPHSGQLGCLCCNEKNQKILEAYRNYFFSPDPAAWYADLPEYKLAMQARFRNIKTPNKQDLKDLHLISSNKLYEYIVASARDIKLDIESENLSQESEKFSENISIQQLIRKVYDALLAHAPNSDAQQLVMSLQGTKNAAERAPVYIQYYCTPSVDDTLQQRNFKAKYARMFENYSTHDEVLKAMRKEARDLHIDKKNALHKELSELQLAQSAHLKNKAKKAEKDQRLRDQDKIPKSRCCSLEQCKNDIDPKKENIECAICEWIDSKGGGKGRLFYCSVEHAEEDFDNHDRQEHKCFAGDRCFYFPQPGPPGETTAGGVCLSCMQSKEGVFYFCSTECYHHNIDWHSTQYHIFDYQRDETNILDYFEFTQNMKSLS